MSCDRASRIDQAAFRADPQASEWDAFRAHYPTCIDCAREVASWSQLVAELRKAGSGQAHPSEASLLAFQTEPGRLAERERAGIEGHLAGCAQCRNELAVLRDFDFGALAPATTTAVAGPSFGERVRDALTRLAETLFGVPQPAYAALAALLALALPAAVLSWWLVREQVPAQPPIAREAPPSEVIADHPPGSEPPTQSSRQPAPLAPAPSPAPGAGPSPPTRVAQQTPTSPPAPEPTPPAPEPAPRAPERTPPAPEQTPAPMQIAALLPSELPSYQPNLPLVGGSLDPVRLASGVRAGGPELPRVRALGPEHVGATSEPSPVLYWDLDRASDAPVEITLVSEDAPEPLLELRLAPPVAAGLHALPLAEHGVRLEPGTPYLWYVALVPDEARREDDVVAGGGIRYAPPDAELGATLAAAGPERRVHRLAEAGYWYDAFATVMRWLERDPDAPRLKAYRDALLAQVGLPD